MESTSSLDASDVCRTSSVDCLQSAFSLEVHQVFNPKQARFASSVLLSSQNSYFERETREERTASSLGFVEFESCYLKR